MIFNRVHSSGVRPSMNHYYYGRQNRSRPKKLPRPLLEQTPKDVVGSKKRQTKATVGATPKRSRTRLDISTTPAIWQREVDSDDDMEAMALANSVVPESVMSDKCRRMARATGSAFCSSDQPLKHTS